MGDNNQPTYHVPGMGVDASRTVIDILQRRLAAYNDLHLALKHVHWNVVGRQFIGVHEMLDPQVDLVRGYADQIAERIAAMGASPRGRAGDIIELREWEDYALGRDTVGAHLGALDKVYEGVVSSNRRAIEEVGKLDPVTEDLLIGQAGELEKFHWFVRAHLEDEQGRLVTQDAETEQEAAATAR